MVLGIVIGNSRVRHARLGGAGEISDCGLDDWETVAGAPEDWLDAPLRRDAGELRVAAVRDDRLSAVEAAASALGRRVVILGRDAAVPIENRYRMPAEVGVDRLLNALAARVRWPGRPVVVLDFGTALSVSVVSSDGAFRGGLIGLGAAAAARGLVESLPELPAAPVARSDELVARSTREAIGAGLFWQLAGGAGRIVRELRQRMGERTRVVATGGDAAMLADIAGGVDLVDPWLTLRGLALCGPERGTR